MSVVASTITQTITPPVATAAPVLVLQLRAASPAENSIFQKAKTSLMQLVEILEKYENWNDPLSLKLFDWGAKAITIISKISKNNDYEKFAKESIQFLVQSILVSDLTGSTLKTPLLDRQWVWEEAELKQFQAETQCNLSPFDQIAIQQTPHLFANAMISWVDSSKKIFQEQAQEQDQKSSAALAIVPTISSQSSTIERTAILAKYRMMARDAIQDSKNWPVLMGITTETWLLQIYDKKIKEEIAQQVELCRARLQQHEKETKDKIDSLQNTVQQIEEIAEKRINETNLNLQAEKQKMAHSTKMIAYLKGQVESLNHNLQESQRQVQELANRNSGGGCVIL